MAEFHLHGQIIKRSEGRSAVNAAAYRAGEALYDKRLGVLFDYTRKQEVEESIILGPDHAPAWLFDREMLWNTVEAAERHRAAQLSREFDIALPVELVEKDPVAAKAALKSWARDMFVAEGLIVDINFHDMESHNPHAHIMTTMRRVDLDAMEFEAGSLYAFESTKARDQNDWGYMDFWRETWADYANAAMEVHGIDARIDHRTLKERGIDREPSIHIGPDAKAMDDRGIETDRATKNAIIWYVNAREFFEENDRYVAFLDAEAAEDRRREEERIRKEEAERKELEVAAAIVVRASELSDLGLSLDAAIARQISSNTKSLVEAAALLDPGPGKAVADAELALAHMIRDLVQHRAKIEAGLSGRREEVARVEARLDDAIGAFVDAQASRLAKLGERLVDELEVELGDKAARFYEAADRFEVAAHAALALHARSLAARLGAARPDVKAATKRLQRVAGRLDDSIERRLAISSQKLKSVESALHRVRPVVAIWVAALRHSAARVIADVESIVRPRAVAATRSARKLIAITAEVIGSGALRATFALRSRRRGDTERDATEQVRSTRRSLGNASPPDRSSLDGQRDERSGSAMGLSFIELLRSWRERLRRERQARRAKAAQKAARAATAALDRDLRGAERAIRAGVDYSAPEAEQLFVAEWLRTLKSTDGPMRVRYEEADIAALKGFALRMDRRPQFGELDKVLIRLSPFAGGVRDSAKIAPDELPEGLKPDFRHSAIYTEHVRWVLREVGSDRDVANHFEGLLRASVEARRKAQERDLGLGRYTGRTTGRGEPGIGD